MKKAFLRINRITVLFAIFLILSCGFSPVEQNEPAFFQAGYLAWPPDGRNILQINQSAILRYPIPQLNPLVRFETNQGNQIIIGFCAINQTAAVIEDEQKIEFYDATNAETIRSIRFLSMPMADLVLLTDSVLIIQRMKFLLPFGTPKTGNCENPFRFSTAAPFIMLRFLQTMLQFCGRQSFFPASEN
jgi:hypothetical protein